MSLVSPVATDAPLILISRGSSDYTRPTWRPGAPLIIRVRVNCPCPEQGQNLNSQHSSAISAPILPTEPEDHDQSIHRVPVNELIVIFRFYGENWRRYCTWKFAVWISALFGTGAVYPIWIVRGPLTATDSKVLATLTFYGALKPDNWLQETLQLENIHNVWGIVISIFRLIIILSQWVELTGIKMMSLARRSVMYKTCFTRALSNKAGNDKKLSRQTDNKQKAQAPGNANRQVAIGKGKTMKIPVRATSLFKHVICAVDCMENCFHCLWVSCRVTAITCLLAHST